MKKTQYTKRVITSGAITYDLDMIARKTGIDYMTLYMRIRNGAKTYAEISRKKDARGRKAIKK